MPISPKEAREKRRASCTTEYLMHVEKIDAELAEGGRTISVEGMSTPCQEAIAEAYREAGWDVTYVPDWRDGDYFQFAERA